MLPVANLVIPSSNFQSLFNSALASYAEKTGKDLAKDPLAITLQTCDSPDDILNALQEQALAFNEFRNGDRKLLKWLNPTVHILHGLSTSGILNEGVTLAFPPAKVIFAGIAILFATAKDVSASYDALVELFECLENFLKRLKIYTGIPPTPAMTEIAVKILVELVSVLALATKQIKQGRFKKYAKKLLGESDVEAVLQRLDRLTQEEARTTVAQTLEVIYGLVNNMKVVMDDGKASTEGIRQALVTMQQTANDINKMKRDQLQRDVRNWLSPPDPSINHNTAREAHHNGTSAWFIHGSVYKEWKTTGSLLWIHGKPGSGKSILCSAIIHDIESMREAGLASMAYSYFDFKDTTKQDYRGLLASLLFQLCGQSDTWSDILSDLYSKHRQGSQQPSDTTLSQRLSAMLKVPGQPAIYVIVDALDECPNTSGMPSPREKVLQLIEELVALHLPNLRICITSRPEVDIRAIMEPLAPHRVSLHDESEQKKDIIDYVNSIVCSDPKMAKWREEDRKLVIDTLSQRVDGMFRWVYCQLETLRRCFPASIRRALGELPATLDETYERALLGIDKEKQEYAHRLFQCLAVSARPLRIEELAEIFAVQLDAGITPKVIMGWRPENAEDALLSACSSLIAVINTDASRVVQFSHFSVKEFLTSDRLAISRGSVSHFHVPLEPAHTILAQTCLTVLLQLDDRIDADSIKNFPLVTYAAENWVNHARFEKVSLAVKDGMDRLFDQDKPQFSAWLWIHNFDTPWQVRGFQPTRPAVTPLYYAALCGFQGLTERLSIARPRDVNSKGGSFTTPLHAASSGGYSGVVQILLKCGAYVNGRDNRNKTPLHIASQNGYLDVVRLLLDRGGYTDTQKWRNWNPLELVSSIGGLGASWSLLHRRADVDARDRENATPLHAASRKGHIQVVRFLLERGADVSATEKDGNTPLHLAACNGSADVVQALLDRGADTSAEDKLGATPLHMACSRGCHQVMKLLLDYGANVNARNVDSRTPLYLASENNAIDVASLLLERGADIEIRSTWAWAPLHIASLCGHDAMVSLLLEHGAHIDAQTGNGETPLKLGSAQGKLEVVRVLLLRGADVNASNNEYKAPTPLHTASKGGHIEIVRLLLEYGADINARNSRNESPFDLASGGEMIEVAKLLIERGASVDLWNNYGDRSQFAESSSAARHSGTSDTFLENSAERRRKRR